MTPAQIAPPASAAATKTAGAATTATAQGAFDPTAPSRGSGVGVDRLLSMLRKSIPLSRHFIHPVLQDWSVGLVSSALSVAVDSKPIVRPTMGDDPLYGGIGAAVGPVLGKYLP
ncbi:hypothetical protein TWF730_005505 [Orbilia blumenaviensis]|uniref:Uncharacterized protein n=1 Tax=Orbilia blumenaviensis TaxID=1796055 RepID=A0AAV9VIT5_9PEZI